MMDDEQLILGLRQEGYDHFGTTLADVAADRIEALIKEKQYLLERIMEYDDLSEKRASNSDKTF